MSDIIIIDTSVLLNVLDVPAFNQHRAAVLAEFGELVDVGASFLLPLAAIFETGNHIAHLRDGRERRRYAKNFRDRNSGAMEGAAHCGPSQFPSSRQLGIWVESFPDMAMGGSGMSDLSIIKAWDTECARHRSRRVRIWTLDRTLQGYDRMP